MQVWLEKQEDRTVSLVLYCEKLLPLLAEDAGKVWWMLSTLTDQVLGEIPAMALIGEFEATDKPQAGPSVLLEALPQALEELGLPLSLDAQAYLNSSYTAYELEPEKDPGAAWRMDVFAGVTRCPALVSEYLAGEGGVMDDFHRDGAVPGFFCYPLDGFDGEDRGKRCWIFAMRWRPPYRRRQAWMRSPSWAEPRGCIAGIWILSRGICRAVLKAAGCRLRGQPGGMVRFSHLPPRREHCAADWRGG